MLLALGYPITITTPKLVHKFRIPLLLSSDFATGSSIFKSNHGLKASFKSYCLKNQNPKNVFTKSFSVLDPDTPWESGSLWSIMALYFFSLHIPLSFGSLSVTALIVNQAVLDSQTKALSILVTQTLELTGALLLLGCTAKSDFWFVSFFGAGKSSEGRSWLLASMLGFGSLILLLFFSSFIDDIFDGSKAVNNPTVKQILQSGNTPAAIACITVYCMVTPLLEETVYRGFLLTSLASQMKWPQAVVISSAIFSAAHFSAWLGWKDSPLDYGHVSGDALDPNASTAFKKLGINFTSHSHQTQTQTQTHSLSLSLSPVVSVCLSFISRWRTYVAMGDFLKERTKGLAVFFKRSMKVVGESFKKGGESFKKGLHKVSSLVSVNRASK